MIPVGTLCIIVNGHERAGQSCTVTAPCTYGVVVDANDMSESLQWCYGIDLASGESPGEEFSGWAARRDELLPIAPPSHATTEELCLST